MSMDQTGLLRSVADYAATYLTRSVVRPVSVAASTAELRAALGGPLPAVGESAEEVLRALIAGGEPGLMSSTSGRFFGFVMGGAYPVGVATELLMSAWDQCAALYATSPTASVVEEASVGWLTVLFGLPASVSAGITSGCATANLTGLAAARHHVLAQAGWDVEEQGLSGHQRRARWSARDATSPSCGHCDCLVSAGRSSSSRAMPRAGCDWTPWPRPSAPGPGR